MVKGETRGLSELPCDLIETINLGISCLLDDFCEWEVYSVAGTENSIAPQKWWWRQADGFAYVPGHGFTDARGGRPVGFMPALQYGTTEQVAVAITAAAVQEGTRLVEQVIANKNREAADARAAAELLLEAEVQHTTDQVLDILGKQLLPEFSVCFPDRGPGG